MRPYTVFLVVSFVVFFSACSTSRPVVEDEGPREPTLEERLAYLPQVETFDTSPYPAEPPRQDVVVQHVVPEELMQGLASAGVSTQRSGFRVQVALVREKVGADAVVDEVTQWLDLMREDNPDMSLFQKNYPVHNIYLQPYFRVRVGDFVDRDQADELLAYMIDEFPRALVVEDQINIQQ